MASTNINISHWKNITSQCTWVTTYLLDYEAFYNPFAKIVAVRGSFSVGVPNQHVFCTIPKKPMFASQNLNNAWDGEKNMKISIVIDGSTRKIRTSHTVNTTTGTTFSFSGIIPVEN